MHLAFPDVNTAFRFFVEYFADPGEDIVRKPSRVGEVLQIDSPVVVTYMNPTSRVLINRARDCNPFFHMFESLWMLAGRNDVAPLSYYSSNIGDIASDDGKTFNGAYGYRWRHSGVRYSEFEGAPSTDRQGGQGVDQLKLLVEHLQRTPNSRRAVLQMWNVEDDLLKVDTTKDVCCNTAVFFTLREKLVPGTGNEGVDQTIKYLDMTVTNRSNDLIWGMLGANVVHFSFLQEWMAGQLNVEVGLYHQITNNLHVYTERFKPKEWLRDTTPNPYTYEGLHTNPRYPLDASLSEIERFVNNPEIATKSDFLTCVAAPMCLAFRHHKNRDYLRAHEAVSMIQAFDWKIACRSWLHKREDLWSAS